VSWRCLRTHAAGASAARSMREEARVTGPRALDALVSPLGVISQVVDERPDRWPEDLATATALIGGGEPGTPRPKDAHVTCGGRGWRSPATARLIAIAEAAERYAGGDFLGEHRIVASADQLGSECLEPSRYPRCSEAEYASPACPVTRFDPAAPIRWVSGLDLASGDRTWVPAVMACYRLADRTPSEEFGYRISTGYAVHTNPVEAVLAGACEVVERDMIAITWLQRLPLPPVDPAVHTGPTAELIAWNASQFVDVHLFDATSEFGVPIAYCVLAADHDPTACRVLGAGTGRSLGVAAEKALGEAMSVRHLIGDGTPAPESIDEITSIDGGARYMAVRERAGAFEFLLRGADQRQAVDRPSLPDDPAEALATLVGWLSAAGMRAVVVDRTPRELVDAGLTAVSVVIPDLQPMCLDPRVRFAGHRRLYEAPRRMGYPVLSEEELTTWPQPFA
jgi:ribosomal protein S12 methylthiotransferase accessory factor